MAKLPVPSEELPKDIPNPRRQSARFYARGAVVLAPLTGVLAVLAGLSGAFALLGGVILPVGCALVLAYSYGALRARFDAREVDRQLEDFRRGRALAVWHCSAEEWRRFTEVAARILKEEVRLDWILAGIWGALFGLFGTCAGLVWQDVHGGVVGVIGIPLGLLGGVLLGLGFSFACDRLYGMGSSAARRRYRRVLRGGGPTYFGRTGVYTNGEFHGWGDGWCQLRYVRLVEGDPSYLRLVLGRPVPDGHGGTIDVLEDVCVPVPAGHLAEARKVVAALGGSHEGPPKPRAGRPLTADEILSAYRACRGQILGWSRGGEVELVRQSLQAVLKFLEPRHHLRAVKRSPKRRQNLAAFLADLPEDQRRQAESFFRGRGCEAPRVRKS